MTIALSPSRPKAGQLFLEHPHAQAPRTIPCPPRPLHSPPFILTPPLPILRNSAAQRSSPHVYGPVSGPEPRGPAVAHQESLRTTVALSRCRPLHSHQQLAAISSTTLSMSSLAVCLTGAFLPQPSCHHLPACLILFLLLAALPKAERPAFRPILLSCTTLPITRSWSSHLLTSAANLGLGMHSY
ncbi:hypothetical protein CC78DRAFT_145638 [Lojkania enalia]|uniref:Uncharacterized protein n=1 Tax=Lojkania enalia TaxID=147567 RepID=A0A9P4K0X0_9PLEO|nr:hypothetical protein CC78DRAFT_145638 [Didymosphaeria enalia]